MAGSGAPAAAPERAPIPVPAGLWLIQSGKIAVEIYDCKGRLCGKLVWARADQWPDGKPKIDTNNPDPKLRDRDLCGLDIVWDMKPARPGKWVNGHIYDPKKGQGFAADLEQTGPDEIRVRGYKLITWIGKTLVWHPAPAGLARCDQPQSASNE